MFNVTSNVSGLSSFERHLILQQEWYVYTYGIGIIFMKEVCWDCSNSVGAKQFLDENGIEEKLNPPSNEQKKP
jgi:hypothetical protein